MLARILAKLDSAIRIARICTQTRSSDYARLYRMSTHVPPRTPGTFRFSFGPLLFVDAGTLREQYREIFFERGYEVAGLAKEPRIIDCGGNVGISAIWFARRYPGATITVFEADPAIAEVLQRNVAAHASHAAKVIHAAVGARSGFVTFLPEGSDSGRVIGDCEPRQDENTATITVPAVRLGDLLDGPVDILKIDIEGAEWELLRDLCQSGKIGHVRHIVCEVHVGAGTERRLGEICLALSAAGFRFAIRSAYTVWWGEPPRIDPTPFPGLNSGRSHLLLYAWRSAAG